MIRKDHLGWNREDSVEMAFEPRYNRSKFLSHSDIWWKNIEEATEVVMKWGRRRAVTEKSEDGCKQIINYFIGHSKYSQARRLSRASQMLMCPQIAWDIVKLQCGVSKSGVGPECLHFQGASKGH